MEPLHRRAGGKKAAINAAAEFFEPCGGIHDVAIEGDGAFDVADLADDRRAEMQASEKLRRLRPYTDPVSSLHELDDPDEGKQPLN